MRVAQSSLVLVSSFFISSQTPAQTPSAEARRPTPQPVHEIIIYRDRNFSGPAVSIRQDETNLRLVWTVNSARVHSGRWQLCERPHFQGPCLTLSRSENNIGHRRVQSVRLAQHAWRELGRTNVFRVGWINTTIDVRDRPVPALRRERCDPPSSWAGQVHQWPVPDAAAAVADQQRQMHGSNRYHWQSPKPPHDRGDCVERRDCPWSVEARRSLVGP